MYDLSIEKSIHFPFSAEIRLVCSLKETFPPCSVCIREIHAVKSGKNTPVSENRGDAKRVEEYLHFELTAAHLNWTRFNYL